ncbi:MAG: 50S ribosomal protein L25 [Spirochaetes bacterium]|nr:50S ribosomal protein L25 [Spirochaetota bacterium]
MAENVLTIQSREQTGKGAAKKLRRRGLIPGVMYGYKGDKAVTVHGKEFLKMFEDIGEHAIITLDLDEKEKIDVIVKDYQVDPVKRDIIHIDFLQIKAGQLLKTEIPVKLTGASKGVKMGGILEEYVRDIEIECLPKDLPEAFYIDVTDLDIGDSIHVKDIQVGEEIRVLSSPEQVVLTIGMPSKIAEPVVEEEEVTEEAEAAGEAAEEAAEEEDEKE